MRRVLCSSSVHAYWGLIGACNPMGGCYGWLLWVLIGACNPMHVFRQARQAGQDAAGAGPGSGGRALCEAQVPLGSHHRRRA